MEEKKKLGWQPIEARAAQRKKNANEVQLRVEDVGVRVKALKLLSFSMALVVGLKKKSDDVERCGSQSASLPVANHIAEKQEQGLN